MVNLYFVWIYASNELELTIKGTRVHELTQNVMKLELTGHGESTSPSKTPSKLMAGPDGWALPVHWIGY